MSAGRYAWMSDALCAQADSDAWTDPARGSGSRLPKRICGNCPAQADCAAHEQAIHAFDGLAPHGIWGGRSHRQRERDQQAA
jgi:hypothetical protein